LAEEECKGHQADAEGKQVLKEPWELIAVYPECVPVAKGCLIA
jgi:hypothetical protein